MTKRRILKILRFLSILAVLVVAVVFVKKLTGSTVVKEMLVDIIVDADNQFISEDDVVNMLNEGNIRTIGMLKQEIDLIAIESLVSAHQAVDKADAFTTHDGLLIIKINQRKPVLRVFDSAGKSFIIDHKGNVMPLFKNYPARLPVATGFIPAISTDNTTERHKKLYESLLHIAVAINQDDFLLALVEQLYVKQNGDVELITKMGPESILIGDATDLQGKIERLKLFYEKGIAKTGWNKYSSINIKINNQVICTKN